MSVSGGTDPKGVNSSTFEVHPCLRHPRQRIVRTNSGRAERPGALQAALVAQLQRIPEGDISETARRAGISVRQLQRIRAGAADIRLSTLQRLAEALGVHGAALIGGTPPRRRPAPIGRRRGKPRGVRRDPLGGKPEPFDDELEDDPTDDEEV